MSRRLTSIECDSDADGDDYESSAAYCYDDDDSSYEERDSESSENWGDEDFGASESWEDEDSDAYENPSVEAFDVSESSPDDDEYRYTSIDRNCTPTTILANLREPEEDTSTGWLALQLLWLVEVERTSKKPRLSKDGVIMDILDDLECNPQDRSCIPACALSRHKLLLSHDDGAAMLVALIRSYRTHLNADHHACIILSLEILGPVLLVVLLQAALDVGIDDAVTALIRVGANVDSSPEYTGMAKKPLRPVLAAACVDARVLQVLLAAKADVNAITKSMTALTLACELERVDEVNILLAADANPHVGRFKHQTVFEIALQKENDGVLHALLKRHPELVSWKAAFDRVLDRVIEMDGTDLLESLLAMKQPIDTLPKSFIQAACVHAARWGSITAVRYLLDAKADINGTASEISLVKERTGKVRKPQLLEWRIVGSTPLHAAARGGFASMVKLLLDAKANAATVNLDGETPLVDALYSGNMEVVRMLMDECGDVEMNGVTGQEALTYAVEHGHVDIVKVLLDKGADPNALVDAGQSLLMVAAAEGLADIVQALVDKDVDVNMLSHNGESALSLATQRGFANVVKILLDKRADVNVCDARGHDVLYHAVIRNSIDVLQTLVDNDVAVRNSSGERALLAAIEGDKADAVKVLIDAGVDMSAQHTCKNLSPLWAAMQKGATGVVRVLLAAKANVEERNSEGKAPLIYAVEESSWPIAKTLLTAKADVHTVDRYGNTALKIVLKLDSKLDSKLDNESTDDDDLLFTRPLVRKAGAFYRYSSATYSTGGRTHQDWAIARWLLTAKAQVDVATTFGSLHDAVYNGDLKRVRTLVQAKADLSATYAGGNTPLMLAVGKYTAGDDIVHLLSSAWVVRKALDKFSDTLLLDAIAEGRRDVAKVLIDAGVDVDVCNDNGDSAVMCAIATRQMSVLRALLASGANTDTANNQQVTPMQYAESQDSMVAVRALSARDSSDSYDYIPDPRKFWASAAEYREATAYLLSRLERDE